MEQKRASLLLPPPAPSKPKKEPMTYCFELNLAESNDNTYPEFSWRDMVHDSNVKQTKEKVESGVSLLNPYASDDEDDLKAMAARFEAKYSSPVRKKKEKHRRLAEDFIDKGAGYDESDSFIDNSDIYDEIVPIDLQPVHGGFYINSGALDFKQVEVSDDEEEDSLGVNESGNDYKSSKKCKSEVGTSSEMNSKLLSDDHASAIIKKVSRGIDENIKEGPKTITAKVSQKRRGSNSSGGSSKQIAKRIKISKPNTNYLIEKNDSSNQREEEKQFGDITISRSRSSSPSKTKSAANTTPTTISITSTSDEDGTCSETSDDDGDEDDSSSSNKSSVSTGNNLDETRKTHSRKSEGFGQTSVKSKKDQHDTKSFLLPSLPSIFTNANIFPTSASPNVDPPTNPLPPRRLKVKNVPLNPKLHRPMSSSTEPLEQTPPPDNVYNSGSLKNTHLSVPPPLSQQPNITGNNVVNLDFFSNPSYKDNNLNLPKLPTLTPAPTMANSNTSNMAVIPPFRKTTNRMSFGTAKAKPKNFVNERRSDGFPNNVDVSFMKTNTANSKSMSALSKVPSASEKPSLKSAVDKSSTTKTTSKNKNPIIVTKNTFNKIKRGKPKATQQQKQSFNAPSNDILRQGVLNLNTKHSTNALPSTQAQILQQFNDQVLLAVAASSSNSFNYQSPIYNLAQTNTGSSKIAATIPANRAKSGKRSNVSKQKIQSSVMYTSPPGPLSAFNSLSQSQFGSSISITEVKQPSKQLPPKSTSQKITRSNSNNQKRNSKSNNVSPVPFISRNTPSPANSIVTNSVVKYPQGKHITPYDVSALLSSNNKKTLQ